MNRAYRKALENNDIVGAFKAVRKEVQAGIDPAGKSATKHYVKKHKGLWTSFGPGGQRIMTHGSDAAGKARAEKAVAHWNKQAKARSAVKKTTKRRP